MLVSEVAANKVFIAILRFIKFPAKIRLQIFKSVRKQDTLLDEVRLLPILCKICCFSSF